MKLKKVRIREYQSIRNSNEFNIDDITCLVGKNESGKTAILKALYKLNPVIKTDQNFDVITEYPRSDVEDYRYEVEKDKRHVADVVEAVFELEDSDLVEIRESLGDNVFTEKNITLTKNYTNVLSYSLHCSFEKLKIYLIKGAEIPHELSIKISTAHDVNECYEILSQNEQTSEVTRLNKIISNIKQNGLEKYLYDNYLQSKVPKFLYFDEFYQMKGFENIETLKNRVSQQKLEPSDHPMLGLIELARLDLNQLLSSNRTEELVSKLEGAGNYLSKKVLKYWSQNKHIQMKFDVRPAKTGDPYGMTTGTNIWAGVYDSRHMVTTNLGIRSRGFVWFFSFLAWYSQIQRKNEPIILLLDEPGLVLHAKAQDDLLKYFEEELKPNHQVIYTTHSPFLVDSKHLERVRIVQDKGNDTMEELTKEEEGTKVLNDIFEGSQDSLFPLQGALGYELYQNLFIGPNSLIVEGVSDLIYIQTISGLLHENGMEALNEKWVITPVGGSDKVPTFVSLLGFQKGMRIATLIDVQKKDIQAIENLYKRKLLKKNHVLTFGDFIGSMEADIEDMFEKEFYLRLVNEEYKKELSKNINLKDLNNSIPRIVSSLENYFEKNSIKGKLLFSHFRPARYFAENVNVLKGSVSDATLKRFEEAFKKLNSILA